MLSVSYVANESTLEIRSAPFGYLAFQKHQLKQVEIDDIVLDS